MTRETLPGVLLWSGLLNYAMLALWGILLLTARGFLHRVGRWYGASDEQSNLIQYGGLVFYKVCILMFFMLPYIALRIVG